MTVYCNRVSGCVRRGGTWVFGGGERAGLVVPVVLMGGKMAIMATSLPNK